MAFKSANLSLFRPLTPFPFAADDDAHADDAAHTMMISDIATNAWLIDFCDKAIKP